MSDAAVQPSVEARAGRGLGADARQDGKLVEELASDHLTRLVPHEELRALLMREVLLEQPREGEGGICWLLIPKADKIVAAAAAAALSDDARLLVKPSSRRGPFETLGARWPDYVRERTETPPLVIAALGSDGDHKEIVLSRINALLADQQPLAGSVFILVNAAWVADLPPGQTVGARDPDMLVATALRELRPIDVDDFEDPKMALSSVQQWATKQQDLSSLLLDLTAPGFARVTRRYWGWKEDGKPGEDSLLGDEDLEIDPRPMIARFLVAYFADLNPADFSDLSTHLMAASPLRRHSLYESEPARVLTDANLNKAKIAFGRMTDRRPYAEFIGDKDMDAQRTARAMRAAFRDKAPLMRERMTAALRDAHVFGHETPSVANDFVEIELMLLREGSRDPASVAERLRRIIFGSPDRTEAVRDVHGARLRAIERSPELLSSVVRHLSLSPSVLLNNLANQRIIGHQSADFTPPWMVAYLSWAFWGKQRLALSDFPAWSSEGFTEEAADAHRAAYLMWLRNALSLEATDTDTDDDRPVAKAGDVLEAGSEGSGDLVEDWSSGRLAGEAAAQLLERTSVPEHLRARMFALSLMGALRPLYNKTWAEAVPSLAGMPEPEPLIRAALSKPFGAWLLGSDQATDYNWSGWDIFAAADWMLEALFAKSALGVYESSLLQLWLAAKIDGAHPDLQFTSSRLWRGNRGDPEAPLSDSERGFAAQIVALLPIVPILLALTTSDASVSDSLREWLVERGENESETPLARLNRLIKEADKLQGEWSTFLGRWQIPLDRQQRARADALLRDRREAVVRANRVLRNPQTA